MCEGNDTSTWNDCIGRIRLEGEIADCSFDLSEKILGKIVIKIYINIGAHAIRYSLANGKMENKLELVDTNM